MKNQAELIRELKNEYNFLWLYIQDISEKNNLKFPETKEVLELRRKASDQAENS
jgi:hypothetical protein